MSRWNFFRECRREFMQRRDAERLRLLDLRDNHLPSAVKATVRKRWPFALL